MKRLIIVLKKSEPELRAAIAAAGKGFVGAVGTAAGADMYTRVKQYLAAEGTQNTISLPR
jgi:hypothetical protein